jgi:hypothetical protein
MAQRVVIELACDVDEQSSADVKTVSFGYQGENYELELCAQHQKPLDKVMTQLVPHSRRVTARRSTRGRRPASSRQESTEIRTWAKANGIKVSDRGRIAADVLAQYHAR